MLIFSGFYCKVFYSEEMLFSICSIPKKNSLMYFLFSLISKKRLYLFIKLYVNLGTFLSYQSNLSTFTICKIFRMMLLIFVSKVFQIHCSKICKSNQLFFSKYSILKLFQSFFINSQKNVNFKIFHQKNPKLATSFSVFVRFKINHR